MVGLGRRLGQREHFLAGLGDPTNRLGDVRLDEFRDALTDLGLREAGLGGDLRWGEWAPLGENQMNQLRRTAEIAVGVHHLT
jgi:hypothetical protein